MDHSDRVAKLDKKQREMIRKLDKGQILAHLDELRGC